MTLGYASRPELEAENKRANAALDIQKGDHLEITSLNPATTDGVHAHDRVEQVVVTAIRNYKGKGKKIHVQTTDLYQNYGYSFWQDNYPGAIKKL